MMVTRRHLHQCVRMRQSFSLSGQQLKKAAPGAGTSGERSFWTTIALIAAAFVVAILGEETASDHLRTQSHNRHEWFGLTTPLMLVATIVRGGVTGTPPRHLLPIGCRDFAPLLGSQCSLLARWEMQSFDAAARSGQLAFPWRWSAS